VLPFFPLAFYLLSIVFFYLVCHIIKLYLGVTHLPGHYMAVLTPSLRVVLCVAAAAAAAASGL
jgi:hypothetical protein